MVPPWNAAKADRSRRYASTVRGERRAARSSRKRSTSGSDRGTALSRIRRPGAGSSARPPRWSWPSSRPGCFLSAGTRPSSSHGIRRRSGSRSRAGGKLWSRTTLRAELRRVLAWGALNARLPDRSRDAGGVSGRLHRGLGDLRQACWKSLRDACGPYRGPALPWLVGACTARDGSHWAIQRWQRHQANFGIPPWKPGHGAWELRLSHWRGPPAKLGGLARLELRRSLAPPLRTAHVSRASRARLLDHSYGRSARSLRPGALPRHARLGLRARLAARERLRLAKPGRHVLLRVRSAHDPCRRVAAARSRSALPPCRERPGCHSGRRMGGAGATRRSIRRVRPTERTRRR